MREQTDREEVIAMGWLGVIAAGPLVASLETATLA